MSRDSDSKWSKVFFPSEVPSIDLYDDRSIENSNFLPIGNTDQSISILSTGT